MKNIKIITKEFEQALLPHEASELRSQITGIQAQILKLNQQAEELLQFLVTNKKKNKIQIVEETNQESGLVTEYYDGQIINQKNITPETHTQSLKGEPSELVKSGEVRMSDESQTSIILDPEETPEQVAARGYSLNEVILEVPDDLEFPI